MDGSTRSKGGSMIIKQKVALVTSKYDRTPSLISYVPRNDDDFYTVLATKKIEVEFDMPSDIEIRDKKIANLKAQRTKIEADAQLQVEQIDEAIQSLMALEAA